MKPFEAYQAELDKEIRVLLGVLERRVDPEWARQILLLHPVYQLAYIVHIHECCRELDATASAISSSHIAEYTAMHVKGDKKAFLAQFRWFSEQVHKIEDQVSAEMKLDRGAARKETAEILQKLRSKTV